MSPLEIKVIEEIISTLKSFDTYPIYREVNNALNKEGIEYSKPIMKAVQEESVKLNAIVRKAESWATSLLGNKNNV